MNSFLIVGLGASAGGIQALKDFFEATPAYSGVAYVVILHLSPNHDSQLAQVLQHSTKMPVCQVTEKIQIEPNQVYVIPPDQHLDMKDGYLVVTPNIDIAERRAPVDIFFRSLAESHDSRAVGVVLSGTGANGSMGLKRIKERGGAVFAQNPREAEFNEMPRNAVATNLVDEVLSVAEIPAKIIAYRDSLGSVHIPEEPEHRQDDDQQALRAVLTEMRLRTGHDFSNYKRPTLLRRIERRIHVRELPDLPAYAAFLHEHPEEIYSLLKDLLISVTNFFRDKKPFEEFETNLLPQIMENRTGEDALRFWVAGCATGEEAYSIAMICADFTRGMADAPKVQIFATDIDEPSIVSARRGFYTLNDAADVPPDRLKRYFIKEADGYRVRRELRELIMFANHDFLKDSPFSHIDLVSCRNVLIYLNRQAQERVFETFHFALKPGGYLMLGTSESVDGAGDLFNIFNREQHIWQSRQVAARSIIVPESIPRVELPRLPVKAAAQPGKPDRVSFGELHLQLVELYAPPSLVVNEEYDIVHISEHAGRYLKFAAGEPTAKLLKLVHEDLRPELRSALYQAAQRHTAVSSMGIKTNVDDSNEKLNIHVRPVPEQAGAYAHGFLLVVFEPVAENAADIQYVVASDEPARHLEEAVTNLKAQLRTSNEQHEFAAEELKAGNEELQAMNEELRSASEELETGKEELQSINEELSTVNQELKVKVEESSMMSNNLRNIINSTDIGTIILDRSFRVVLFTPAARNIFNLIPADQARPLSDITNRLREDNLVADAERVLQSLQSIEREMEAVDGRTYLARLTPYRTEEDRIRGVVISFVDITARKKAESDLRAAEEWRKLIIQSAEDYAIFTLDLSRHVNTWNIGAQNVFGFQDDEIIGKSGDILFIPEDREKGDAAKEAELAMNEGRAENERWHLRKDGSRFWGSGLVHPLRDESGQPIGFVKIMRDRTEKRLAEEMLSANEARQTYLVKLGDGLRSLSDPIMIQETASRIIGEQLGVGRAFYCEMEADGDHMWIRRNYLNGIESLEGYFRISEFGPLLAEEYHAGHSVVVNDATTDPRLTEAERAVYLRVSIRAFICVPLVKDGRLVSVLATNQPTSRNWTRDEITLLEETAQRTWAAVERARAEEALAKSEEKYRTLFDSIDEGFSTIEVLFDEAGKAVDYRLLEMNRAHEQMSRMPRSVVGKRVREFMPGIEESVLERLGKVALTGEPIRYEEHETVLDRWFDVYIARVGGSHSRIVANVFNDITARKRHEANLAFLAQTSADFSPLAGAGEIMQRVAERLANYLHLSRCHFAVVDEEADRIEVIYDWRRDENMPDLSGVHSISENLTEIARTHYSAGRIFLMNTREDIPEASSAFKVIKERGFSSLLGVPHLQNNRWKFLLTVGRPEGSEWREDEQEFIIELVSRIYLRIERALAEEALQASEERLQNAISIETVGVIFFDLEGTIHDVNDAFLRMSGYIAGDIENEQVQWNGVTPPEFIESTQKSKEEFLTKGQNTPYEKQYSRPDGTRWWGLFAGKRLSETECVEFVIDITKRKQSDEAVRESVGRLSALAEASSEVHYHITADWGEMRELSGRGFLAYTTKPNRAWLLDHIPPEDHVPLGAAIDKAIQTKTMMELEHRVVRADGTIGWTLSRALPILAENGEIAEWFGAASDITARKEAEESLRQAHASLVEILESIGDVFYALDKDFRYTYVNNKAEEAWSMKREEMLGKTLWEIFPQVLGGEAEGMQLKVMETREAVHYEAISPILHRWISVGIFPSSSGGLSVFFHDIDDRKQAEEALRVSETRARTLADAIPHVIWTNTADGFANYFNRRWYEYTGLTYGQSAGPGWEAIVHPDDAPLSKERWKNALEKGDAFDTEYRLRSHHGMYRWFIGRNVPLRNEAGDVLGWFGSATDIEDLKQAQESLTNSEERLRVTVESATDYAIITSTPEGIIEGWSRGAERIFGYSEEEAIGQHAALIFSPEDIAAGVPQQEMSGAEEQGFAIDERWHRRKDDSRFFMSGVMRPIYDGQLRGFVKVARDLTEKQQAEEVLRISEERYRVALGSAEMAAWDWNVVDNRSVWNDEHYFILGLQPDGKEKTAAFFLSFVHAEDVSSVEAAFRKAVLENSPYRAEFRIVRADNGEIRWMSGYGSAVTRDNSGHAGRIVGVMHDITARKRVEEQKDEFIGIASHELRTPVTGIKAYTEILKEMFEESNDVESAGLMNKLDKQVDRLTTLIYALLDTTRITEGKLQLQKTYLEIDELIIDTTETMRSLAGNQRIVLELNAKMTVFADQERIRQVLINLIGNAIKYSPGTDHIIVRSSSDSHQVKVCVQDFGMGIDKTVQQQVFDRFFRGGEATTFSGLGLGLFISATIVRQHGGNISVQSRKGAGALFCFTIPITAE